LLLLYSPHEISGKSSECDYSVFLLLLKSRKPKRAKGNIRHPRNLFHAFAGRVSL